MQAHMTSEIQYLDIKDVLPLKVSYIQLQVYEFIY